MTLFGPIINRQNGFRERGLRFSAVVDFDLGVVHRRRKETEGKAKVVASVWVAKFVQFLAALAVLSRSI